MQGVFDHEKLRVYQSSIEFVALADDLINCISRKAAVKDQLDRASTSIPLNIAEGNGKNSARDKTRFFEIARGSALECAACLDVCMAKKLLTPDLVLPAKSLLLEIVSMACGLINSLADKVMEEEAEYRID